MTNVRGEVMTESQDQIKSEDELRSIYREPSEVARKKVLQALDQYCQQMIALSPFVCIATKAEDGSLDISPRGDPPGSIKILSPTQVLIPDRYGNNRLDSLTNLTHNPEISLLFLIPGVIETLRVKGVATIIANDERLETCAINGKVPATGILVDVQIAFLQCGKALKRSALWEHTYKIERTELASFGAILAEQTESESSADELDCSIDDAYKNKLY